MGILREMVVVLILTLQEQEFGCQQQASESTMVTQSNLDAISNLDPHKETTCHDFMNIFLVGGAITILKNDGVRQWEGLSHILWKNKIHVSKPPTRFLICKSSINPQLAM
jgi:hypothetical protein